MQLSLNWIKEYLKLPAVPSKDLALAVTMATVEVEGVVDQSEAFRGIVVGRVREVVKHPNADRLSVCRVAVKDQDLQIVCGGSNLREGMLAAVATVGSRVRWHGTGEYVELNKTAIRGIESNGMIVSSDEIGLSRLFPKSAEAEIIDLSNFNVRVGESLARALGLDDVIMTIDNKSMTHRPDLWGQYGLAREIAALYQTKLKPLDLPPIPAPDREKPLQVSIENQDLCLRYAAIVIDDITATESPWWLKRDLEAVGLHSINSIVDITNYVMILLGQPLHAFDYDAIAEHRIIVSTARAGRSFTALNETRMTLPEGTLMIADPKKYLAIAGIIGGKGSGIGRSTKTIVIESANFSAPSIRRTARRLGVRSDASSRFEKKLDPALVPQALALAVSLIKRLHPEARIASPVIDKNYAPAFDRTVEVPKTFLDMRLGKVLEPKLVVSLLERLAFEVSFKRGILAVRVPSFRSRDISIPEDIVEEVARLYGYGSIEPSLPSIEMTKPSRDIASRVEHTVKWMLAHGFGYTEVYNYSFDESAWSAHLGMTRSRLAVKNYLTPQQRFLRHSLLPGLLARVVDNLRWTDECFLFEMGRVFSKAAGEFPSGSGSFLPKQPVYLAGIAAGRQGAAASLYRSVKGMVEQLLEAAGMDGLHREAAKSGFGDAVYEVVVHDKVVAAYGMFKRDIIREELADTAVVWWEVPFEQMVKFSNFSKLFRELPKYPAVLRDVAVVIDESVRWDDVARAIGNVSPLLRNIELFDIFMSPKLGAQKKSFAFTVTLASPERTLESKEVDAAIKKINEILAAKFGAIPR